jgi:hypothetical protein
MLRSVHNGCVNFSNKPSSDFFANYGYKGSEVVFRVCLAAHFARSYLVAFSLAAKLYHICLPFVKEISEKSEIFNIPGEGK